MSNDGRAPAVDSRAANDPLLQEIVEAGTFLDDIGSCMTDCLNPEGSDCDGAKLAEFRDMFDKSRSNILGYLEELRGRFQPEADGATNYSPGLCDHLVWHLDKAVQLIIAETDASDDERSDLAKQIIEVADKIKSAGTNPTELHRVPKLAEYEEHLRKQQWAELSKRTAEREQREFEWPTPEPYLYHSDCQPKVSGIPQASGIDATSVSDSPRKLEELFSLLIDAINRLSNKPNKRTAADNKTKPQTRWGLLNTVLENWMGDLDDTEERKKIYEHYNATYAGKARKDHPTETYPELGSMTQLGGVIRNLRKSNKKNAG